MFPLVIPVLMILCSRLAKRMQATNEINGYLIVDNNNTQAHTHTYKHTVENINLAKCIPTDHTNHIISREIGSNQMYVRISFAAFTKTTIIVYAHMFLFIYKCSL